MKIAPKLSVLLAKNHWRLTFCLPLYISGLARPQGRPPTRILSIKIAPKLSVLLAKNHWRLTSCLPLYI